MRQDIDVQKTWIFRFCVQIAGNKALLSSPGVLRLGITHIFETESR
jgi:hypothetical protein